MGPILLVVSANAHSLCFNKLWSSAIANDGSLICLLFGLISGSNHMHVAVVQSCAVCCIHSSPVTMLPNTRPEVWMKAGSSAPSHTSPVLHLQVLVWSHHTIC